MDWTYYTYDENKNFGVGKLYDEQGNREAFDGRERTAEEWQAYLEDHDIRGTVL